METGVQKKKLKPWAIGLIIGGSVAVVGGLTFAGIQLYNWITMMETSLAGDHFYEGVIVQGVDVSGMTKEEAKVALTALEPSLRPAIALDLSYADFTVHYNQDNFTFSYDTDAVLEEAYLVAREGQLWERYDEQQALLETPATFEVTATLQPASVTTLVSELAGTVNRGKQEAELLAFTPGEASPFAFQDGFDGWTLDEVTTVALLEDALAAEEKAGTIALPIAVDACLVTTATLQQDIALISTFSTVSTNTQAARSNMAKALELMNGTVLQPGEVFSFNDTVGNSSLPENGWLSADTLSGGRVVQDYGGGVCQAATTLYGAAMRADLEVVERDCHRWPSSYVDTGLDATISYGNIDFRIQNPYSTPIYIESYMVDNSKLIINLYGRQPEEWDRIEVSGWTESTLYPAATIETVDSSLAPGERVVDISSRNGLTAAGQKTFYKDDVEVKTEAVHDSYYRPVQGEVRVGPAATPAV